MLKTIDRYVLKELLWSSLAVVLVLLTVLLGNTLVHILGDIADGKLPIESLWTMLLVNLVHYLLMLLPLSVFLGILLGMGRFYRDSEMSAMYSCGIGGFRLYRPVLALALPAALFSFVISMYLAPWTASKQDTIRHNAKHGSQLSGLTAGQFNLSANERQTIFFEHWSDDGKELEHVFLQNKHADRSLVQTSKQAELKSHNDGHYVVFKDGRTYQGEPGQKNHQIIDFVYHGVLLKQKPLPLMKLRTSATPTAELLHTDNQWLRAELHWRIAVPILCFLLALLALPLSYSSPRKGRFGKVGLGILVYIVYTNMLGLGRAWLERGKMPEWLGLWWAHALILLAVVLLLAKQERKNLFVNSRSA